MTGRFRIEALAGHDRAAFSCGTPALDQHLRERASQDAKRLVANCFVAVDAKTGGVAGYYTLAATSVLAGDLPQATLKSLPRYPMLPAALVGRLAVDRAYQSLGLGGALLADAALRVLRRDLGAMALIAEAKDTVAVEFYRRHGFQRFASRDTVLFLPLDTVRVTLG